MLRYIVQRLLLMIPTLIAISIVVFTIIQLPPGDYLDSYIAELQAQGEIGRSAEDRVPARVLRPRQAAASSNTCTGSAACCTATSAIRSSSTCR